MLTIGLTGNIASGKSTVLELFREWGATVIDADVLVREVQAPGSPVLAALAEAFGDDIIRADGTLDRAKLRGRTMGRPDLLETLNGIVHPAVLARREELLREARAAGARIVVSDIPLLFEVLDPGQFDLVVLVDAPGDVRRERLMTGRGFSPEAADRALASQAPSGPKRALSDIVIDNAGTREDLRRAARRAWEAIEARARDAADPA